MKIKLKSQPTIMGGVLWQVETPKGITIYSTFDGAQSYVSKYVTRHRKELSAFSLISNISINLCSTDEEALIKHLRKTKCKGITKRQYGFVKGIYERQQRDW